MNKLIELINEEIKGDPELPPYFRDYLSKKGQIHRNQLVSAFETIKIITERYNLKNKNILEIGSHFGLDSFFFSYLGVGSIIGIEYYNKSLQVAEFLLNKILDSIKLNSVSFRLMDVQDLHFNDCPFDFVYCNSVISHIPDFKKGYQEIFRVLKPGGTFFCLDENNILKNRKFRRENWKKADFGPDEVSKSVGIDKPFIDKRKDIIKNLFPNISSEQLSTISEKTYGYVLGELDTAVKILMQDKNKIKRKKEARDPLDGYWAEREINPYIEFRLLKKIGFKKISLVYLFENKPRPLIKKIILDYLANNAWPFLLLDTHFALKAIKI